MQALNTLRERIARLIDPDAFSTRSSLRQQDIPYFRAQALERAETIITEVVFAPLRALKAMVEETNALAPGNRTLGLARLMALTVISEIEGPEAAARLTPARPLQDHSTINREKEPTQ